MTDLVQRLRDAAALPTGLYAEAAGEIERLQAIREAATRIIAAWDAAENQPIGCDLKGGRDYWAAMFAAIDALRERLKSCTP